jgi:hypothetical protein
MCPPLENSTFQSGFFSRGKVLFVTDGNIKGTGRMVVPNFGIDERENVDEKFRSDDDWLVSVVDFAFGSSSRFVGRNRLVWHADFGASVNSLTEESLKTDEYSNYWAFGFYYGAGLQINLVSNLYLDIGIAGVINLFSGTRAAFEIDGASGDKVLIPYEDAGRMDMTYAGFYLLLGWRIDTTQMRQTRTRGLFDPPRQPEESSRRS